MGYLLDSDTESEAMSLSSLDDSYQEEFNNSPTRRRVKANFNVNITQGDNETRLSGLLALKAALNIPDIANEEEAQPTTTKTKQRALPGHTKSCDDALISMAKARRSSTNKSTDSSSAEESSYQDFLAQEQNKVGDLMERIRQKREQAQEQRRLAVSKNKCTKKKPSRSSSSTSTGSNRGEALNEEEMSELQRLKALKEKKRSKRNKAAPTPKRALPGRTKSCDGKLSGSMAATTPLRRGGKKPLKATKAVAPSAA